MSDLRAKKEQPIARVSHEVARIVGQDTAAAQAIRAAGEAEIAVAQSVALQKTKVNAEYVLSGVVGIVEEARAAGDYAAALKGLDLLGRHLGLWARAEVIATLSLGEMLVQAAQRARAKTIEVQKNV